MAAGATKVVDHYDPEQTVPHGLSSVGPDAAHYFAGTSWVVHRDDDIDVLLDGTNNPGGVCQEFGVTDCVGSTFGVRKGVRRR